MSDNVRINIDVVPNGTPELEKLAAALRVVQERNQQLEASLQRIQEQSRASAQTVDSFQAILQKLGGTKLDGLDLGKELAGLKSSVTGIGDAVTQVNAQRIRVIVDTSELSAAGEQFKRFERDLEAAKQKVSATSPERSLAEARLSSLRRRQLPIGNEDLASEHRRDLEEAERRVSEATAKSDVETLQAPLARFDTSGIDAQNAKLREQIALETSGEEGVLKLRVQELEAIRQRALAEAKSAEAVQLVNSKIDARIAAETNHAGLTQELRLRQEIAETEQKVAALVEKTNQRELSGVQKIEAERAKSLAQVSKLESRGYTGGAGLRSQINTSFDAQRKEEEKFSFGGRRGLNGNALQSALYASYSPQTALFSGISGLAEKLPAVGIAAGIAAVAVGTLVKEFYGLVESEASAARETLNTASRLGLTGEQVQKLSASAALVGVNFSAVEGASRQLAAALEEPTGTGKRAADALAKLGIATYQTTGRARELGPVFLDVLKALSHVSDTAERLDLANKLLPRGGAKQIQPWIEDIDTLNRAITELGIGAGKQDQIEKLAEVDKQFQELHQDWAQLKRDFAEALIPVIKPLVGGLKNVVTTARGGDEFEQRVTAEAKKQGRIELFGVTGNLDDIRAKLQHDDLAQQIGGYAATNTRSLLTANLPGSSTSKAELRKLGTDVEGKEVELSQAKEEYRTARAKVESDAKLAQLSPVERQKAFSEVETADKDIKQKEAELKALRKQDNGRDPFGVELDRIQAEARKFKFPASEYGRITELQNELVKKLKEYNDQVREGTLTRAKANILAQQETANIAQDIKLEQQRLEEERRQHRAQIADVGIEAGLDTQKRDFSSAERLARINSRIPEGDPALVEQAYQHQLAIAQSELKTRLAQNESLIPVIRKPSTKEQDAKDLADAKARAQFTAATADAEISRKEASAEIDRREFESAKKNTEELARIRQETEQHGYEFQIEHAARLAELNRDNESPVASLERVFETQKKLSQLAFYFDTRQNAITFADDPGQRKFADEKARQKLIEDGQKAEYEREEKLAELRKQEREAGKAAAASLYDAIRGGPKGLHDFFKGQADKIGQNAFASLLGPTFQNISKSIDPTGQGAIHNFIQGTLFGGSTGAPALRPDQIGPIAAIPAGQELPHHSAFHNLLASLASGVPANRTAPLITPSADIQAGVLAHPEDLLKQQSQTVSNAALEAAIAELAKPGATKLAGSGPESEISTLIPHLDPVRTSLDTLRTSVDSLAGVMRGTGGPETPGAPAQQPPIATTDSTAPPVLSELQAHSLVHSSKNAVKAAETLANTPVEPVVANVDTEALTEALKQPKPPISPIDRVLPSGIGDHTRVPLSAATETATRSRFGIPSTAVLIPNASGTVVYGSPEPQRPEVTSGIRYGNIVPTPAVQPPTVPATARPLEWSGINSLSPPPATAPLFAGSDVSQNQQGSPPQPLPFIPNTHNIHVIGTIEHAPSVTTPQLQASEPKTAGSFNGPAPLPGLTGRYSPLGIAEYIVPPTLRKTYLPDDSDALTSPAYEKAYARTVYSSNADTQEIRTHERIHQAQDQLAEPSPSQVAKALAPVFGGDVKKATQYLIRTGRTDIDGQAVDSPAIRTEGAAEAPAYLFQSLPGTNPDKSYLDGLAPQTGTAGYQEAYNNYVNLLKTVNPGKSIGVEKVAPREFEENYLKTQQSVGPTIGRTDPVIGALDTNTAATKSLTDALINVTPGGGIGPNPLAQNPLPSAATAAAALPELPGASPAYSPTFVLPPSGGGDISSAKLPTGLTPSGFPTLGEVASTGDLTGVFNGASAPTPAVAPTSGHPSATAQAQSALQHIAAIGPALRASGAAGQAFGAVNSASGILGSIQNLRSALHARAARHQAQQHLGQFGELPSNLGVSVGTPQAPELTPPPDLGIGPGDLIPANAGEIPPFVNLPSAPAFTGLSSDNTSPNGFATLPQNLASIADLSSQSGILSNGYSDSSYGPAAEGLSGQFGQLPSAPAYTGDYPTPALGTLGSESAPLSNAPAYVSDTSQGPVSISPEGVPTFTALGTTAAPPDLGIGPADLIPSDAGNIQPFANLPSAPVFGGSPNLSPIPAGLDQQITGAYPDTNSAGTQVLPQSVLDAADPFNNPLSSLKAINSVFSDLTKGFSLPGSSSGSGGSNSPNFISTSLSRLGGFGGDTKDKPGSSQQFGDIFSTGATLTAGALGAISGFKHGGIRGDLSGTASILGTAAVLDFEPVSKAILGIAAGITAAISSLLPDLRAQRERQLTRELFNQKVAAEPFTQPGITVDESATGHAVSQDYLGDIRTLNARPYVYTIREATGFDPLHGDRVVTAPVRQVGIMGPPEQQSISFPNAPVTSRDMSPVVNSFSSQPSGFSRSTVQDSARQDGPGQQAPAFNVTFQNEFHSHAMDSQDIIRRGPAIADALVEQLQSTHRISQAVRDTVSQS